MIWTYRVFRDKSGRYSIREVFYERDGRLINYSKQPVIVVGASLEDLIQLVAWFREAFDSPVLALEDVEAELAANPPATQPKKSLSDRSQTISFQQVLAELAKEVEKSDEVEGERVTL